jgi:predicted PurR-regulated permease PerM
MTLLLTAALVLPLLLMFTLVRGELADAYQAVASQLSQGPLKLPEFIAHIPWLGKRLQEFLTDLTVSREALGTQLSQWIEPLLGQAGQIVGGLGRNLAKLALALLTLFFFYRDGERLVLQVRKVLLGLLGERVNRYLTAVGNTAKAVVYGIVLTAVAQGVLAGIGYWAAGVDGPALLAAMTGLIALLPFGTPFVWGSVGIWLLLTGKTVQGVRLLLWGFFVVSWVDNLIRPLMISGATKIPFLLVLFGVLGGLAAFGLVGLFLGPVILAVLVAVWQEWLEEQVPQSPEPESLESQRREAAGPALVRAATTPVTTVNEDPNLGAQRHAVQSTDEGDGRR